MLEIFTALMILVLLIIFVYRQRRSNLKRPPGPKGVLLLGNIFQFDFKKIHLSLDKYSKQYGDIFQFSILGQKFVSLNSASLIRDVFLHEPHASITAHRPPSFMSAVVLENADVAFTSPSREWTKRRKLAYKLVNAYGEGMAQVERMIKRSLREMKNEIQNEEEKPVHPKQIIDDFVINTIEMLMTGEFSGRSGKLQTVILQMVISLNILGNVGADALFSRFPFLRFMPLHHSKVYKESTELMVQLVELIKEQTMENGNTRGVYHELTDLINDINSEHTYLTSTVVQAILTDLVGAGTETTSTALRSLIHILATRQDVQHALQEEVDTVIGKDREPMLSDRENCPKIQSILLETLRYISHLPAALPHFVSESCVIDGYHIDQGTVLIANLWSAHHNAKDWENPYEFLPWRFLDESGNLLPSTDPIRKNFLAFGIGKRSCIGEVFAKSRMFLFLSTLMQTVTIKMADNELTEFSLYEMKPGLVLNPKEYKVKFLHRTEQMI